MAKRTVIAPDEELIVKGKLVVTGNLVQIQQTDTITNLQGNIFTINSDSSSDSAILQMKSGLSGGGTGSLTYAGGTANVTTGAGLITVEPGFKGNLHIASGQSIVVSGGATLSGNVFSGNAAGALAFTSPVTIALTGDVNNASNTFINAGDTATITTTLKTVNSNVGSFGDAFTVPNFTVNAKGLVTAAGESLANISSAQVHDFTDRVRANVSHVDAGGDGSFSYSSGTGVFTYTGPNQTEANARITAAPSQVRAHLSVTDAGGDGSLAYSNVSGVITYTGPSASEVRAHLSGSSGVNYDSSTGAITGDTAEIRGMFSAGGDLSYDSGTGQVSYTTDITLDTAPVLGGNLITNGNRITHAGSGTVSFLDFTKTLFSETNHTVLSSVKSIDFFLDANGGDSGQAFRIYNNQNPDGSVTENTYIFKVAESGDVNITGTLDVTGNVTLPSQTSFKPSVVADNYTAGDGGGSNKAASTEYVEAAINALINGADGTMNTLGEIGAALGNNTQANAILVSNSANITTLQNRNISTGDGLSGGGNLTADRTLTVDATVARTTTDMIAGSGLTGGGTLASDRTFNIGAGTGITVNANDIQTNDSAIVHDNLSGFVANEHVDHSAVTLTAGDGLSGGGDITTSRSFAVDSTVIRTTGDQSLGGIKTFTGDVVLPVKASAGTEANSIFIEGNNTVKANIDGTIFTLTPTGFTGTVESVDVGGLGIDVLAGSKAFGNGTTQYYIRSINSGTYTTSAVASNVITIDGNISAIRGGFSGTGLISYNSGTGAISTTADNYSSWKYTTGSAGNVDISSDELLTFAGGSGISVSHSGSTITITNTNTADITSVGAGSGLTGGGTSGAVSINVGQGYGISVGAESVAVSNSDIRGLFSVSGDGISYDSANGVFSSSGDITEITAGNGLSGGGMSGAITLDLDFSELDDMTGTMDNTDEFIILDSGTGEKRKAANEIGLSIFNNDSGFTSNTGDITAVVAGTGLTGGATSGSATLNANATYIKGLFSASDAGGDGSFAYNSSTGTFTYTGPSASEVRAHISAGTGISITDGEISSNDGAIVHDSLSGFVSNEHVDHSGVTLTAGSGLTGGGDITTSRSFNVGQGSYIVVNANDVAVDATTTNTASKVVARDGSGNFAANVITATATQAQYADLAENYLGDADYEPGTVLILGGSAEVTQSDKKNTPAIAGVVTTNPAHLMNEGLEGDHVVAVALRGRIPCKVKGPVRKGDVLIASDTPGHAEAAPFKGYQTPAVCVIGKAISEHLQISEGVVEILV